MMYLNAVDAPPPPQPWSDFVSQSSNCCSDSATGLPVRIALIPSTAPVAENAQQLPAEITTDQALPLRHHKTLVSRVQQARAGSVLSSSGYQYVTHQNISHPSLV
jgi:hypothetical protein